jgi:CxxC-x17-CxxC domain-containing protein
VDFKDKTLVCFDCKNTYVFTADEQQAFHAKGHNHPPKRCPACRTVRAARKPERGSSEEKFPSFTPPANRQMYNVTCSECGKETQVPFEPRAGRPIYCSDCYRKNRASK